MNDVLGKIEYGPRSECWRWRGQHSEGGRPQHGTARSGVSTMASHRVLAIFTGCPVPAGCEAHHTCGNAWCVNPWHLRVLLQAGHRQVHRRAPEACVHGHAYSPENTGWQKRGDALRRYCKTCNRARVARWKARQQ